MTLRDRSRVRRDELSPQASCEAMLALLLMAAGVILVLVVMAVMVVAT